MKQKCIITIEGDGKDCHISILWKPKLNLKDNSKNNLGVVKLSLAMMNSISSLGKTKKVVIE